MTSHRFFLPPASFSRGGVLFPADVAHQIRRVLRLRTGDRVVALDGSGREWPVRLTVLPETVHGTMEREQENAAEPRVRLTLYQGLLKAAKLELVIQKCTELGVSRFVPMDTARAVAAEPGEARQRRFMAIAREAAEQSGRGRIPVVNAPVAFADALVQGGAIGPAILLWEDERERRLQDLALSAGNDTEIGLYVGPEGGFTAEEVSVAVECGVAVVSLGPRILRAETAAIAGVALMLARLD